MLLDGDQHRLEVLEPKLDHRGPVPVVEIQQSHVETEVEQVADAPAVLTVLSPTVDRKVALGGESNAVEDLGKRIESRTPFGQDVVARDGGGDRLQPQVLEHHLDVRREVGASNPIHLEEVRIPQVARVDDVRDGEPERFTPGDLLEAQLNVGVIVRARKAQRADVGLGFRLLPVAQLDPSP